MARIRAVSESGTNGRTVTIWTPSERRKPPASATWEITVALGSDGRTGRRRQWTTRIKGATWTQVREIAAGLEHQHSARCPTCGRNWTAPPANADAVRTVNDGLNEYIAYTRDVLHRATKTVLGYESIAGIVKTHPLGKQPLHLVKSSDIEAYYGWLGSLGRTGTTIAHHHMLLRQMIRMAVRREWLAAPGPEPIGPKLERPEPYSPSPEDARALIGEMDSLSSTGHLIASFLLLAGITGCRRGEVCGWRWSDFDNGLGRLTVQQSIGLNREVKTTKTKRGRPITFGPGAVAVLSKLWDEYVTGCSAAALEPNTHSYIFSLDADHSEPLDPNYVTHMFGALRTKVVRALRERGETVLAQRLERTRLADFRHFAATQTVGNGIDVRTAASRLGHDPSVLLRHYSSALPTNDRRAADVLEGLLLPTTR